MTWSEPTVTPGAPGRVPPLLAIIGLKNSGKTTLLVRLAAELVMRGLRVATIKHGTHTFNIDPATTDTYRHFHEGRAEAVAMIAPDRFALVRRIAREPSPEEVAARFFGEADIVLCEGFKASKLPKVEIFRREANPAPLYSRGSPQSASYVAIVTDDPTLEADVPILMLDRDDHLQRLADLVERVARN
ncbi:MAG TPA: molybdopterin-guanine dinucleotide biosynthesis protein B [Gemmatimonadaceae bacterium]|nr:molybdopterin-guanine dinucleotide biosynthesis protein B [Gemmatimonadaceae bacterium]